MAAHSFVTQFVQQPPNTLAETPGPYYSLAILLIHALQAAAAMIFYAMIRRHWELQNFPLRVLVFALLLATINENLFRRFLMDIIADHRHVGYEFLVIAMPTYTSFLFVALIVVTLFDFQKRNILIYSTGFLLATLGYQLPHSASALMSSLLSSAGGESTRGPYNYDVLVASYVTYLLPVAGMYVAYFWTRLSLPKHGRSILFFFVEKREVVQRSKIPDQNTG